MGLAASAFCQQKNPPAAPTSGVWKISGKVVDAATGVPLPRAEVTISLRAKPLQTVVTGADGRFSFEKLEVGRYDLHARHPGYIWESFEEHGLYSAAVNAGPDAPKDLVFRLHRDASISGKVTDEQNEPVDRADISLVQAGVFNGRRFNFERGHARTNSEGVYTLVHLPPGKYFLIVTAEPWYAQRRSYLHPTGNKVGPVVAPGKDQRAAPPELDVVYPPTLYPGTTSVADAAEIELSSGSAFTANIQLHAVPSVYVQLPFKDVHLDNADLHVTQMVPGIYEIPKPAVIAHVSPGVVEIGGLTPGHYRVTTDPSVHLYPLRMLYTGPGLYPLQMLYTGPGPELEIAADGQVTIKPAPNLVPVTGHVEIQSSKIVKDLTIWLRSQDSGESYSADASAKGDLEFKGGVPAGTYDVLLGETGLVLQSIKAEGAETAGQTVKILPDTQPKLIFVATSAVSLITGTALNGNKAFAGAMMVLVPDDPLNNLSLFRRDESNMNGSFAFTSVLPGHYTILALENGWDLDWSDPKVWQPLVARGMPIEVAPRKKYTIQAEVRKITTQR